ncbi:MAG: hypothetical protein HGA87_05975 [Desulfobulbaceae bacterium]|nr:hypothetical protein [Desulfobulbaceae bacterium]
MGTSQSSAGPKGRSPLVPAWADDQPQQPLPQPLPARFKPFRQSLGGFISSGDGNKLKNAIGHYARKASGGSSIAARRLGSITKAGGNLFDVLRRTRGDALGEVAVDLNDLAGQSCAKAISSIVQALTPMDGDAEKIRLAMNHALVEALDGVEIFDPESITDDVIVNIMIGYLSESIFLQIVMDGGKAWNKAETAAQAIRAEDDLRELIRVIVDKYMASQLNNNFRSFTRQQIIQIERQTIVNVWNEWEAYQ